jgi:hypothetical protein
VFGGCCTRSCCRVVPVACCCCVGSSYASAAAAAGVREWLRYVHVLVLVGCRLLCMQPACMAVPCCANGMSSWDSTLAVHVQPSSTFGTSVVHGMSRVSRYAQMI